MTQRQLRKQCRQLLSTLDIRPPLDVADLCHRMGKVRGRPIRLVAHPIPAPGPFGVWIATTRADYILFQEETTKLHQDHIILHELGWGAPRIPDTAAGVLITLLAQSLSDR